MMIIIIIIINGNRVSLVVRCLHKCIYVTMQAHTYVRMYLQSYTRKYTYKFRTLMFKTLVTLSRSRILTARPTDDKRTDRPQNVKTETSRPDTLKDNSPKSKSGFPTKLCFGFSSRSDS